MNLREYEVLFTDALHPNASSNVFLNACEMLVEHGSMTAEQRLLVYRHNVSGGYISALASTFVVCEQILGEQCFASFARDYAWNREEQSNDLNELGNGFPAYIEKQMVQREGFEDYAYLADMARLELLIEKSVQASDSDTENIIGANVLENNDPSEVFPVVNKSLNLLSTDYPILTMWKHHKEKKHFSDAVSLNEIEYLCICRDENDDVIIQSISQAYYELLFISCDSSLNDLASDSPSEIVGFLQYVIEQGWLLGFRVK